MKFTPVHLCAVLTAISCTSSSDDGNGSAAGLSTSTSEAASEADPTTGSGAEPGADSTGSPDPQTGTTGGGTLGETTDSGESSGGSPAEPDMCGTVVAADHPPLETIQRLATTDEEVRILVFGQSISEQDWWLQTRDWLEQQYPGGNLVMEEHAIPGCTSQCLIGHDPYVLDGQQFNRLPQEVFAWRPDLIIFHVYGDHVDYGYIMRAFTEGCSAFDDYETWDGQQVDEVACTAMQQALAEGYQPPEVLIQTDHRWAGNYPLECPDDPSPELWGCFVNELTIPGYVDKWGYELQDNWTRWAEYIESTGIDPLTLTLGAEDLHLSDAGNQLMFEMTIPHLCYTP